MNTLLVILASTVTLLAPEDGAVYDTCPPQVREFLANPAKRIENLPAKGLGGSAVHNDWTMQLAQDCSRLVRKGEQPFRWSADIPLKTVDLEFSETPDFAKVDRQTYRSTDYHQCRGMRPYYLKLGTKYYWRVRVRDSEGKDVLSETRTFTTVAEPPRMIGVPAFNRRDFGGGVNADGSKIRQGLLFRGGGVPPQLNAETGNMSAKKMTVEGVRELYINHLGIKTDLDLRGKVEPKGPDVADVGIQCFAFALDGYHMYLPPNLPLYREIFKVLADEKNYPIYVHCAVGCDRTGSLGILIDGVLGRDDKWCYDNYELSSMHPELPRFRYGRKGGELFSYFDPASPRFDHKKPKVTGKTIRENVVQYLLSIGVKQEEIDSIRRIMIEN